MAENKIWVCPECAQGKHMNCNGQAWDSDADGPTECGCGHSMREVRQEVETSERGFELIKGNSTYDIEHGVVPLDESDTDKIESLLMGRKVTKVTDDHLLLDDGTVLKAIGHRGGCVCGAGDYDLTALNGVDNIITRVEFDYHPSGDDTVTYDLGVEGFLRTGDPCIHGQESEDAYEGHYRIWVYAENQKVNLMEVTGSDGNGYYGTGYGLLVRRVQS